MREGEAFGRCRMNRESAYTGVSVQMKITREMILRKAFAVYLEHGYSDASVSMLQQKMNIGRASMYYYFQSKEELFREMINHFVIEEWHKAAGRLNDAVMSLHDLLEAMVEQSRHIRQMIEEIAPGADMSNLSALILNAYVRDEGFRMRMAESRKTIARKLRTAILNGMKSGELPPDVDVEKAVTLLTDIKESNEGRSDVKRSIEEDVSAFRDMLFYLYDLIRLRRGR